MRWSVMLLCLCAPVSARAACLSNLISVGASGVGFGNYSSNSASDNTASGTITVACTVSGSLPSFTMALSSGGGSYASRHMNFLAATLNYNLYTSSAYTTIWGDGTGSTATQPYGGGGGSTTFTVYGKIPKKQFVAAGIYGDTIVITVTF